MRGSFSNAASACFAIAYLHGRSRAGLLRDLAPARSRADEQEDEMANELADTTVEQTGMGRIITASGTVYELDFEEGTLRRLPIEGSSSEEGAVESVPLRRDGEVLRIIEIVQLQLGQRATFLLEPLGPPPVVVTRRSTSQS